MSDIIKIVQGDKKTTLFSQIKTKERKNIMKNQKTNVATQATATQEKDEKQTFEGLKAAFEEAYSKNDYSFELLALSTAVAYSVIKKCKDPQRKAATERETVSSNG